MHSPRMIIVSDGEGVTPVERNELSVLHLLTSGEDQKMCDSLLGYDTLLFGTECQLVRLSNTGEENLRSSRRVRSVGLRAGLPLFSA